MKSGEKGLDAAAVLEAAQVGAQGVHEGAVGARSLPQSEDRLAHVGIGFVAALGDVTELGAGLGAEFGCSLGGAQSQVGGAEHLGERVVHLPGDPLALLDDSQTPFCLEPGRALCLHRLASAVDHPDHRQREGHQADRADHPTEDHRVLRPPGFDDEGHQQVQGDDAHERDDDAEQQETSLPTRDVTIGLHVHPLGPRTGCRPSMSPGPNQASGTRTLPMGRCGRWTYPRIHAAGRGRPQTVGSGADVRSPPAPVVGRPR